MKVIVDKEACMGYANCVIEAPELFDLDPATDKAIVLVENPNETHRSSAERAVRACPAIAIRIEDADNGA